MRCFFFDRFSSTGAFAASRGINRISAAASATSMHATAEKNALAIFVRTAIDPTGSHVKRCVTIRKNGKPGGCALPSDQTAEVSSPLSVGPTAGASVLR